MINEHEILDINTNIMDNSDISTIKQGQFCKFSTPLSSSLLCRLPFPTYTTILLTSTTTILLCRCPHHRTIHPQPPLSSLQPIPSDLHPSRHRRKISSSPSHRRQTAQITTTIPVMTFYATPPSVHLPYRQSCQNGPGRAEKARKMKGLDNQILARLVRGLFISSPYKPEPVAGQAGRAPGSPKA